MGKGRRVARRNGAAAATAARAAILRLVSATAQQAVARALADLARQLHARAGQLEGEFGADNLAVLALYAASAAASTAGLEAVGRAEGAVGRGAAGDGLEGQPAPDRGPAAVAAPAVAITEAESPAGAGA